MEWENCKLTCAETTAVGCSFEDDGAINRSRSSADADETTFDMIRLDESIETNRGLPEDSW